MTLAIEKAGVWLTTILVALAIVAVDGADLAPAETVTARRIDSWSGMILRCKAESSLALPENLCGAILARAAARATAGKVKFVALANDDAPGSETAKAKAAGFDDALAIEMTIDIRSGGTSAATLDVDARSRRHIMPSRPGEPTQYARIFTQRETFARGLAARQTATPQDAIEPAMSEPAGVLQPSVAPTAEKLVAMFFDLYLAAPHAAKD